MPADLIKALVMAASINTTLYCQLDPRWGWVRVVFHNKMRIAIFGTVLGIGLTVLTGNPLMSGCVELVSYPIMLLKGKQVAKANEPFVPSEAYIHYTSYFTKYAA